MIYLDNNATTKPSPAAADAADEAARSLWANPSSVHRAGQDTRQRVELARQSVANLLSVKPRDVTFTAGATEAIDLAHRGVLASFAGSRRTVVTTAIEHEAVRDVCGALKAEHGVRIIHIEVDAQGVVRVDHLREVLSDLSGDVALVSVQWANNETGSIQPVRAIGELCRASGVLFHTDATQAVGKLPIHLDAGPERSAFAPLDAPACRPDLDSAVPVDLLSCSAHKFHGVKGAGALFVRRGVRVVPRVHGSQERGRRGGTEAVPAVLAMGVAAGEAIDAVRDTDSQHAIAVRRDRFERRVLELVPRAVVNCAAPVPGRLNNTTSIGFPGLEAEILLLALSERGVAASAGAACSSGSLDPSPVLLAMGIPERIAHGSLRFSLSKHTTDDELETAAEIIAAVANPMLDALGDSS